MPMENPSRLTLEWAPLTPSSQADTSVTESTTDSTPETVYVEVENPLVADIDDYYEQDEYGRYVKTVDTAIITGKKYFEIED